MASWFGYAACAHTLIAAGVDVNQVVGDGAMPFFYALNYGHRHMLKILLRAGAHMNGLDFEFQRNFRRDAHDCANFGGNNSETWALVEDIRNLDGWANYVYCRRATLVRAISTATHAKFPEVINAEIASYVEPPGGD